jgi:hypothetical protein
MYSASYALYSVLLQRQLLPFMSSLAPTLSLQCLHDTVHKFEIAALSPHKLLFCNAANQSG